ncbi:MAG: STAS domain-containing protein [Ruminococcus sp.]|nr:STAS domain-containing protein [Ruminococcus sp.]
MDIKINKQGSVLTVIPVGRIDTVTSKQFHEEVNSELNGITKLVLDFSQINYISSAGLRVLLILYKTMKKQGDMIIIHVNDDVMGIFEVTGFSGILNIKTE